MSWVRIWIHLVFSTKNRKPFLRSKELRLKVFQHIKENAKNKGIYMDSIGGHTNHVHCLISLGREQSVSKVAQLIKGESSYWINKSELIKSDFKRSEEHTSELQSRGHLVCRLLLE